MRVIWDGTFEKVGNGKQKKKHVEIVVSELKQASETIHSIVEAIREKGYALVSDKATIRQW